MVYGTANINIIFNTDLRIYRFTDLQIWLAPATQLKVESDMVMQRQG
jgi:hypothetical protein